VLSSIIMRYRTVGIEATSPVRGLDTEHSGSLRTRDSEEGIGL